MNLQVKNQNPKPQILNPKPKTQKPKIQNQNPKTKFQNPKSKTLDPKSKILNAKRAPKAGNLTTFKVSRALPAAGGSDNFWQREPPAESLLLRRLQPPDHYRQQMAGPGRKLAISTREPQAIPGRKLDIAGTVSPRDHGRKREPQAKTFIFRS